MMQRFHMQLPPGSQSIPLELLCSDHTCACQRLPVHERAAHEPSRALVLFYSHAGVHTSLPPSFPTPSLITAVFLAAHIAFFSLTRVRLKKHLTFIDEINSGGVAVMVAHSMLAHLRALEYSGTYWAGGPDPQGLVRSQEATAAILMEEVASYTYMHKGLYLGFSERARYAPSPSLLRCPPELFLPLHLLPWQVPGCLRLLSFFLVHLLRPPLCKPGRM